jgi:hypothetical protein
LVSENAEKILRTYQTERVNPSTAGTRDKCHDDDNIDSEDNIDSDDNIDSEDNFDTMVMDHRLKQKPKIYYYLIKVI